MRKHPLCISRNLCQLYPFYAAQSEVTLRPIYSRHARASLYSFALCVGSQEIEDPSLPDRNHHHGYANNICLPQRVAIMRTTLQSFFGMSWQSTGPRLREFFKPVEAEVASNDINKIHQTWGPLFSQYPYNFHGAISGVLNILTYPR